MRRRAIRDSAGVLALLAVLFVQAVDRALRRVARLCGGRAARIFSRHWDPPYDLALLARTTLSKWSPQSAER
jgi:hypothetical protein